MNELNDIFQLTRQNPDHPFAYHRVDAFMLMFLHHLYRTHDWPFPNISYDDQHYLDAIENLYQEYRNLLRQLLQDLGLADTDT